MKYEQLSVLIENIIQYADEIRQQEEINDIDYGQLLAYAECLTIIQELCSKEDLERMGLAFDIDSRYLL